jgi:hypothetical protein
MEDLLFKQSAIFRRNFRDVLDGFQIRALAARRRKNERAIEGTQAFF